MQEHPPHTHPALFPLPISHGGALPRTAPPSPAGCRAQHPDPAWAPPQNPPSPKHSPSAPFLHSATSATSQPAAVAPQGRLQQRVGSEMNTFLRVGTASLLPHKGAGSLDAAPHTPRALSPNEGHVRGLAALQLSRAASGNRPPPPRRLVYRSPATPRPETRPARGLPPATGAALHRDPPPCSGIAPVWPARHPGHVALLAALSPKRHLLSRACQVTSATNKRSCFTTRLLPTQQRFPGSPTPCLGLSPLSCCQTRWGQGLEAPRRLLLGAARTAQLLQLPDPSSPSLWELKFSPSRVCR